jgi:hypothetical protein
MGEHKIMLLLEMAGVVVWSVMIFSMDQAFSISYDYQSYMRERYDESHSWMKKLEKSN